MRGTYFDFVTRKLKKHNAIVWIWSGDSTKEPGNTLRTWLDHFSRSFIPTVDDIVKNSPDMGDEHERLINGLHISAVKEFAKLHGVGVDGVLFRLKEGKTQEAKNGTAIRNN